MTQTLNAIVVGVGHLGSFHAQKYLSLKEKGVNLVALVDPVVEKNPEKLKEKFPNIQLFSSLAACLIAEKEGTLPKIHLASVATTTEYHYASSMELIRAGKSLLVEKPLASTVDEGRKIVEAAKQAGVSLAVGHVERYRAIEIFQEIKSAPHFIECHRLSPFPARSTDIDVVRDLMIHDIDLMLSMVDSPLKYVHAAGFPVLTSQADIANARFEFENGCVANLTSSRISITRTRKFRIFCNDAYISLDLAAGTYEYYQKDPKETDLEKAIQHKSGTLQVGDALLAEVSDFVDSVREKRDPLVTGADGLRAMIVAEQVINDVKQRIEKMKL